MSDSWAWNGETFVHSSGEEVEQILADASRWAQARRAHVVAVRHFLLGEPLAGVGYMLTQIPGWIDR